MRGKKAIFLTVHYGASVEDRFSLFSQLGCYIVRTPLVLPPSMLSLTFFQTSQQVGPYHESSKWGEMRIDMQM